jgi:hypothetical protein
MGLTRADRHKKMYSKWRNEGYTHKQCIKMVPKNKRKEFKQALKMSFFESHFGNPFKLLFKK